MHKEQDLYVQIPEMSNDEYRQKLAELFSGIQNNIVLRYFYTLCVKLEADWNHFS